MVAVLAAMRQTMGLHVSPCVDSDTRYLFANGKPTGVVLHDFVFRFSFPKLIR